MMQELILWRRARQHLPADDETVLVELVRPEETWIGWYDRERRQWHDAGTGGVIERSRVVGWAPMPHGMGADWVEDPDE
jgi:hypothetical protein